MKQSLVKALSHLLTKRNHGDVKKQTASLYHALTRIKSTRNTAHIKNELQQIYESNTLERSRYYIRRLIKGLTIIKTGTSNDLNLNRWKEYDDILTDSLWVLDKRDRTGVHSADYWGNFIPQIPHQLLRRYTKKGDWVLDPFLGSGTTLIECRKLGRNGFGVELQSSLARKTRTRIKKESNPFNTETVVFAGDSAQPGMKQRIQSHHVSSVQFALLHPPYWNIIRFSKQKNDLSNAKTLQSFLDGFGNVVKNCATVLDKKRYLAVVIGDKYIDREWIPLGFYTMQETLKHGFMLKSIIVKNFNHTKAKRSQEELWRYRALVGGFYVFKHEYIFLFQKK
jgi:DNA modification methylase